MPSISISKPTLRRPFKDINYCYWSPNGQRLYSLSRVIRDLGLKPDYEGVDERVMRKAAARGKLTEWYCFRLLEGKSVTVRSRHCGTLQKGVADRVQAFHRWALKYKPELVDYRRIVWDDHDAVAWEQDLRVRIAGRVWLVDIKCTSAVAKDWPLQLGCGLSYDQECERAAILHLKPEFKDGYMFRDKWDSQYLRRVYQRAVHHWRCRRDFSQLKAELGFDSEAYGFEPEVDE